MKVQRVFAGVFCAAMLAISAQQVAAEPVELETPDGAVTIAGVLVNSNDDFFILETAIGELRLARCLFRCFGPGCPMV